MLSPITAVLWYLQKTQHTQTHTHTHTSQCCHPHLRHCGMLHGGGGRGPPCCYGLHSADLSTHACSAHMMCVPLYFDVRLCCNGLHRADLSTWMCSAHMMCVQQFPVSRCALFLPQWPPQCRPVNTCVQCTHDVCTTISCISLSTYAAMASTVPTCQYMRAVHT